MKTSKIALFANMTCCFLAIIADVFKLDTLSLFSIPLIIPFLFFYYYIETNKISVLVSLFLLFNFIGDSVGLMNFENEIYYILPPFFLSNLIMIFLMLMNIEKFKFIFLNCVALLIITISLFYFWNAIVNLFSFDENNVQLKVAIYGFSLIVLVVIASYNVIWNISISNIFSMVSAICVLLSDFFYIVFNFQNQLVVLDYIHFSCQIFSYFFFVKYVLFKEKEYLLKK